MRTQRITEGNAAEKYAEFINKKVIVYYRDMRGTGRKLYGIITEIRGDIIHMQNGEWSGMLNCANAKVSLVSTVAGWDSRFMDSKEERGLFDKLFR